MRLNSPMTNRRLTVGVTMPLVLVLTVLAEIVLRAVPLERFAFRSLEALGSPDRSGGPFLPSREYTNERSYGDLAGLGNLRSLRQYRREIFTTDRWGYRNAEDRLGGPPAGILLGDSFGVAPGVEDSRTFAAVLSRLWGRRVYNAAGMFRMNDIATIRGLVNVLGMRTGIVIHEVLERQEIPSVPPRSGRLARPISKPRNTVGQTMVADAREWWTTCRVRILAERICRLTQDDRFLPNPHRANVTVRRLKNGKEILFLPVELSLRESRRAADADYWRWMRDELSRDGLRLVVLLVPNKYTVYGPLLDPPVSDSAPGADHLERLEEALRTGGVEVVNLKKVYRERAGADLEKGIYLYWLDDTHWTAHGMRVAAEEFSRAIAVPKEAAPEAAAVPRIPGRS